MTMTKAVPTKQRISRDERPEVVTQVGQKTCREGPNPGAEPATILLKRDRLIQKTACTKHRISGHR
jgi:hypothetical protein